jgi:translation elongation factor P/translation initiation factor 5A
MELDLQYLYNDGSQWNFMDPDSFEQYAIDDSAMDDAKGYLVVGDNVGQKKIAAAEKFNVAILTEENYLTMIR